jgi:WD40 repeat protein
VAVWTAAVAGSLLLGAAVSVAFALAAREKAADAEGNRQVAVTNLYHSLVREARALRLARETGYRARAWERLEQARRLETPDRNLDELRGEAVACMGDFVGLAPSIWDVPRIGRAGGQRLALHPDGLRLALGLDDGTVLVRNLATDEVVPLHKHRADVSAVAFTPDGTKLVTGDVHGVVHVWQPGPGGQWTWSRELRADPPLGRPIFGNELALAISPDGRHVAACPARLSTVALWDLADGRQVGLDSEGRGPLRGAAWSPDGRILAVAFNYGETGKRGVLRWDVAKRRWADDPWPLDLGHVLTIAFSPDGRSLAAGCYEGFGVYDTSDFRPRIRVRGDQARALAFSADGHRLFVTSESLGTLQMWDVNANRQMASLQLPLGPSAVVLGKDDHALFAASRKSVHAWTLPDTEEKRVLFGHTAAVPGLAFSPDGRLLASASKDRTVKIWNPVTGERVKDLAGFKGEIQAVAFSPDSSALAMADWAGELRLLDLQTWRASDTIAHDLGNMIWTVAFSPDQTWFAASSYGRGLQVWRVRGRGAGAAPPELGLEAPPKTVVALGHITAFCFSPDGKRLAWVTRGDAETGYRVSLCDLQDLRTRSLPARPYGFVKATLAFTPDSRNVIFVSDQERLEVWDVGSPPQMAASYGTEELVSGNGVIALSADGAWLASSGNRAVTIWDTAAQRLVLTLPEERSSVSALAWSPEGDLLAVSSSDGGPVIWNIPKIRAQLRTLSLDW